jgi:hypothetical protein
MRLAFQIEQVVTFRTAITIGWSDAFHREEARRSLFPKFTMAKNLPDYLGLLTARCKNPDENRDYYTHTR